MLFGTKGSKIMNFEDLKQANTRRCGESFHPINNWSPTDWGCAMAGECGEACNNLKKLRRLEGSHFARDDEREVDKLIDQVMDEVADMVIYADLLAARLGRSLGIAIAEKFNRTSDEVGSSINLKVPGRGVTGRFVGHVQGTDCAELICPECGNKWISPSVAYCDCKKEKSALFVLVLILPSMITGIVIAVAMKLQARHVLFVMENTLRMAGRFVTVAWHLPSRNLGQMKTEFVTTSRAKGRH